MSWVLDNLDLIGQLTWAHVAIAVPAILLSFLIAVPLGWWAHKVPAARSLLLTGSGIFYALPSLPLFVVLPAILGTQILDPLNLVVALTLYGAALLVRTAAEAFDSVSPITRDAALAMGHSTVQRFWRVDLPLAGPPLLAGLRVVSASTLSLVSVGALIGVKSLGSLFTDGYLRSFLTEIAVGIAGTVLLAVVFDLLLVAAGRVLLPWVRATDVRGRA